jgi:hypothetical protein
MLGRVMGTHVFRDPVSGRTVPLPIERGPDTALPQRLHLPYWYETGLPAWLPGPFAGAGGLPPWLGGPQLERLSSGFGPYGLTRLALATGGTYTIFDRPADRGPFGLDTMRDYQPDYRRAGFIARDLDQHPLRQAILEVVALSQQSASLEPPPTRFFGTRPDRPGGPWMTVYYPSSRFRTLLRGEMRARRTRAQKTLDELEQLLAPFGPDGMEDLYQAETSPRWRAWYDVTRGRLLAMRVRQAEYAKLADLLTRRSAVGPQTNHLLLLPSPDLRGSDDVQSWAREAQRLLQRCVREHSGTPWAYLAQRELDHPLGIDVRQITLPPPVTVPAGGVVVPAGRTPRMNTPGL